MLTDAQYLDLHNDMLAQPSLAAAIAAGDDIAIATFYNQPKSPTVTVWKTRLTPAQYLDVVVWTEVDALTAGKARIWEWMTSDQTRDVSPASTNIRQGIADAFGAATTTRANLLALGKRSASVFEALFATGAGTVANPSTMAVEGPLSYQDASNARVWGT